MHAERLARFFKQARHAQRKLMWDHGAFAKALAYQSAEVFCLVVEAAIFERFIQNDLAAVIRMNRRSPGIPPIGMQNCVATRTAQERVAVTEQIKAGMKLRHSSVVFSLEQSEIIDT